MPRERQLHVSILNVTADPHPEGTYVALLRRASNIIANARGSDYAKITAPVQDQREGRYYTGQILIWTEINLKGRWLDITKGEELSEEEKASIRLPPSAKPNFRVFNYALDNTRHLIYFETRNEFGETLGPSTALGIFANILSFEAQANPEGPETTVTLVPETGAVERILAIPGLRVLDIKVNRPNPDVSEEAKLRVWGHLDAMHARRQEIILHKSRGAAALTPTTEIKELAEVAAVDGEVREEGPGADGRKIEISTRDVPQRLYDIAAARP